MVPKGVIAAYVRRIERGDITLDDVPKQARKEVEKALEAPTGAFLVSEKE